MRASKFHFLGFIPLRAQKDCGLAVRIRVVILQVPIEIRDLAQHPLREFSCDQSRDMGPRVRVMNILISRAVAWNPCTFVLEGVKPLDVAFPILVDAETEQILEPVFRYSLSKFQPGRRYSSNTVLAYLDDLRDWFYYLDDIDWPWNEVDENHIIDYVAALSTIRSPKTGRQYAPATVARRATTVIDFYVWASKNNQLKGSLDHESLTGRPALARLSIGRPPHVTGSCLRTRVVTRQGHTGQTLRIRVIAPDSYQMLLNSLGPAPKDRIPRSASSSRDRLIAEWCLHTGMRVTEVLALTVDQIQAVTPCEGDEWALVHLHLVRTKGQRPRYVEVPIWLLHETSEYLHGERMEVLRTMTAQEYPCALFVRRPSTKGPRSNGVGYRSVHEIFARAVLAAGLTETDPCELTNTNTLHWRLVPRFSHHDLRHTFAVYRYLRAIEHGVAEPWNKIRVLLGHRSINTTIDTYLSTVSALSLTGVHGLIAARFQAEFRQHERDDEDK